MERRWFLALTAGVAGARFSVASARLRAFAARHESDQASARQPVFVPSGFTRTYILSGGCQVAEKDYRNLPPWVNLWVRILPPEATATIGSAGHCLPLSQTSDQSLPISGVTPSNGRSFQRLRSLERGSSTLRDVAPNSIVDRDFLSYFSQARPG
jgi:hypothetical protein